MVIYIRREYQKKKTKFEHDFFVASNVHEVYHKRNLKLMQIVL